MKVVVIGSGNVASHLSRVFVAGGHQIIQVWSRNLANAERLAQSLDAIAIDRRAQLDETAELYLIAVKDEAIGQVASQLSGLQGIVAHTSGATDMEILSACNNYGVLYPLQTFSRKKELNVADIPFFIEAASEASCSSLEALGSSLSKRVYRANSEQRRVLHLSAAFACNFVNQLYALSSALLNDHGLDFDMIRPLIMETALKVQFSTPLEAQTGPALRGDEQTMEHHLALLRGQPELAKVYTLLSESIKKSHS